MKKEYTSGKQSTELSSEREGKERDMNNDDLNFSMNIPLKAHEIAQQFYRRQISPDKAKQVYLNTLAVYSVHTYLQYLEIASNLTTSDSWDTTMQSFSDVADLDIPGYGRLECRPVLPGEKQCYVPPEVWGDRAGYIAAQLDENLEKVTLLGFLSTVNSAYIQLERWRSLSLLLEALDESTSNVTQSSIAQSSIAQSTITQANITQANIDQTEVTSDISRSPLSTNSSLRVRLGQWLDGLIDQSWQIVDHTFATASLSPSFRTPEGSQQSLDAAQVICSKHLSWQRSVDHSPLMLIIGLAATNTTEIDIWVKLTHQESKHLPLDLELFILDDQDQPVIQTKSRGTEGIQLKFGAEPGEEFSVKVVHDHQEIIETFAV
ncbi:MAG: DUF1822 family protein [Leptolyngbyaceae cyanobacterium]